MPVETVIAPPEPAEDTTFNPAELEPTDGDQLLNEVSQFIGRYLECSDHQRTVLALWALHTHCIPAAQVTPYLAIESAEKQSGKSLCLRLLSLLCDSPALTAGFTANALTRRLDDTISTVLLDECQGTVGTRARSKNAALRALLASGYECGPGYTDSKGERNAFSPKAFAGMGHLPQDLADRSISIILKPLSCYAVTHPDAKIERFNVRQAGKEAEPLQERLYLWAEANLSILEEMPSYSAEDFPPNLSPRRQDMIEPLLKLADFIGAEWPTRIREALIAAFQEQLDFELRHSLQLLADLRDCFAHNNYPERLPTSIVMEWMHSLPARPWDADGSITARTIARLLKPFEIHPRPQRSGIEGHLARGYQLQDFKKHWKAHLNFEVPPPPTPADFMKLLRSALVAGPDVQAGKPAVAEAPINLNPSKEIPKSDTACYAVTHPDKVSTSAPANVASRRDKNKNGKAKTETPLEEPQPQEIWKISPHIIPQAEVSGIAAIGG